MEAITGNPNYTITTSLQLMLNIIINTHFKNSKCLVQMNTSKYYDLSMSSLNLTISQYINPSECVFGCDHYILYDPITSNVSQQLEVCLEDNEEYTFKGIVFLDQDSIDDYKFENQKYNINVFDNRQPRSPYTAYAGNAIFVEKNKDYFVIKAFTHWNLSSYEVLNRWNISQGRFEMESIDEFFSDERRKRHRGNVTIVVQTEQIGIASAREKTGPDLHVIIKFVESMNFNWIVREPDKELLDNVDEIPAFMIGSQATYSSGVVCYFPISYMNYGFLVPKPNPYIYWLQLIQVFSWKLWALIFAVCSLTCFVFWTEKFVHAGERCPKLIDVIGLFMGQGIKPHESTNIRIRALLIILLYLVVMYSTVFSSGIVDKMMSVSYANDIRTIEDLADSELVLEGSNKPEWVVDITQFTDAENRSFARFYRTGNINFTHVGKAITHYVTDAKFSTLLNENYLKYWETVRQLDYTLVRVHTSITLLQNNKYMLLMPLLREYVMRCEASGLMRKWQWDAFRAENRMETLLAYLNPGTSPGVPAVLQFAHIQSVLGIWIVGVTVASWVFLVERYGYAIKQSMRVKLHL